MKFTDSARFSPVILGGDLPHERDMYFVNPLEVPTKVNEYRTFVKKFIRDDAWWRKQHTRCINGYLVPHAVDFTGGEIFVDGFNLVVNEDGSRYIPHLDITINADGDIWIPGRMYFYLNFWTISIEDKVNHKKDDGPPWFTDLSWENWMLRERGRREFVDMFWGKCRQRGLSEEEAGDTGWIVCFMEKVQVAIGAGLDVYNDNTFAMVKNGCERLRNTQFYKEVKRNNDSEYFTKYTRTEVHSRTAKDNPQIFSGLNRLYKAHLEEIAIMREGLATEIAGFVRRSLKTVGDRRTGFMVFTGTSGRQKKETEDASLNNLKDLEEMMYNPRRNKVLAIPDIYSKDAQPGDEIACFIPAWKFRVLDEDGNSLKKEGLELIDKDRELESPKNRPLLIALEPKEPKEMFGLTSGGYFGDYIAHHCSEARNKIITHKGRQILERGFLHWTDPRQPWRGVEWETHEDGDILRAEEPRRYPEKDAYNNTVMTIPDALYLQGTDSYDQSQANTSESKLASLVFKTFDKNVPIDQTGIINNFVGMYLDRPSEKQGGRKTAYENTAKMSVYWGTRNMIEYTKIAIFDYYEQYGLEGFLAPRPDMVLAEMIDRSQVSNKYGLPSSLVVPGLTKLKDWLSVFENIYGCVFADLLEKWARFRKATNYNCDLTIAAMCCIVMLDEYLMQVEREEKKVSQPMQIFRGYKELNGRIVEVYA